MMRMIAATSQCSVFMVVPSNMLLWYWMRGAEGKMREVRTLAKPEIGVHEGLVYRSGVLVMETQLMRLYRHILTVTNCWKVRMTLLNPLSGNCYTYGFAN